MLITANWRDWYRVRHKEACFQSGTQFEDYVASVLQRHHADYVNPHPTGTLGDGGCDGLAESGSLLYACYGQRPMRDAERELEKKLRSDFARGVAEWPSFDRWRFVTNAPYGPLTVRALTELQAENGPSSTRPILLQIWNSDRLWSDVVVKLSQGELDDLFPGAPGIANLELADLVPLFDVLDSSARDTGGDGRIAPVPVSKMDFNGLSDASRIEFNAGRLMASRIDKWYRDATDPSTYDTHGAKFRQLYLEARASTENPTEILERLYVALAGPNMRMDAIRANAAYAVVSYFFDSCHIFEAPSVGDQADATTN